MDTFFNFISDYLHEIGAAFFALAALWGIFRRSRQHKKGKKLLQKAIEAQAIEPLTLHPEVNPSLCVGCGTCTRVCPEGDVLQLINHVSTLVAPTKCVGHGECEASCPQGAITLVFGTKTRGMDIPRITAEYETNVPGLYIAGELGGMGLIRNAVKQGSLAARHALSKLPSGHADTDLLIIGAGPAGIAACLEATAQKKSYLCIEQNSFGGTVYNFPRQKIVMSAPAELPLAGTMKFRKNRVSKEELLEYWEELRAKYSIRIEEKVKFLSLEKTGSVFEVQTSKGVITAKKVLLSMGVRGTPRKLGLPNEDMPKVTYNLIDPAQYQDCDIAVVGSGNAGLEAVQYLAKSKYRNRVVLLCRGPDFDRCNDENRNKVLALAAKGQVKIMYSANVAEIHPQSLVVKNGSGIENIANDYLFIFAGAEVPFKMLMSFGIAIEKKFGEALHKTA